MTVEERVRNLEAELRELLDWTLEERQKVTDRLIAEGATFGLDGHPEAYAPIREESFRRYREIVEKYKDLPPGTRVKLW